MEINENSRAPIASTAVVIGVVFLFYPDVDDFTDEHFVRFCAPLFSGCRVEDGFRGELLFHHLFAFNNQPCFGKCLAAVGRGDGGQSGALHFVAVLSAVRAAIIQGIAVGFRVEAQSIGFFAFHEVDGVAGGIDKAECHGFVV